MPNEAITRYTGRPLDERLIAPWLEQRSAGSGYDWGMTRDLLAPCTIAACNIWKVRNPLFSAKVHRSRGSASAAAA
jgi:hypothetical protein